MRSCSATSDCDYYVTIDSLGEPLPESPACLPADIHAWWYSHSSCGHSDPAAATTTPAAATAAAAAAAAGTQVSLS